MKVEDLLSVLSEYPPSSRLVIKHQGMEMRETTVVDLMCRLLAQPREATVALFACDTFLIRERIRMPKFDAIAPPGSMWLELDAR